MDLRPTPESLFIKEKNKVVRKNAKEKKKKTTAQLTEAPQDTTDEHGEQHVADWAHDEDDVDDSSHRSEETTASEDVLWNRFQ